MVIKVKQNFLRIFPLLLIALLLVAIFSGCGGGGSGGGGGGVASSVTPTVTYNLSYMASVSSTNLYVNGNRVSDGSRSITVHNSGSIVTLTFDDTCYVGVDQYQADTYTINSVNPQSVLPGGIPLTMNQNQGVVISYSKIPAGP